MSVVVQVCGNRLLEGGCMTEEKLAKHKDEQVNWTLSFFVVFFLQFEPR